LQSEPTTERLPKLKITQAYIKALSPSDKKYSRTKDNLEARVHPNGRISLNLLYLSGDKKRRVDIARLLSNKISREDAKELDIRYQRLLTKKAEVGDIVGVGEKILKRQSEVASQTLKAASEAYLEEFKKKHTTYLQETRYHFYILKYLAHFDPRAITQADLQYVIDNAKGDRKDRTYEGTRRHVGKAITRFFIWMKRRGYINSREIVLDLEKPAQAVKNRLYTEEELRDYTVDVVGDSPHPAIICAAYCPMRAAELLRLDWDSFEGSRVDGGWSTVLVKSHPEKPRYARFFLTPSFMKYVPSSEGAFFRGRHGNGVLKSNSLSGEFTARRLRLGIGQKFDGVHTFRKSLGTFASRRGHPAVHWQSCLGRTVGGLAGVYSLYEFEEFKQKIWQEWSAYLDELRGV
jgi:integrase